ncbi:small, acid-soluble spore protein, alpha/beta type [Salipaludibacillus sp. HK11]|uniref:small, acid-soluble spore protein, alpha/beta type n=1 Tax=Salipaludibacillus sp. HK11 TaxID=3394320 RepID=UPI0039FD23B4
MKKTSPLIVPELNEYLDKYKEEIAHEFGIFLSADQSSERGNIHYVINKILKHKKTKRAKLHEKENIESDKEQ